jgi:hypothetical protein
VLPDLVALPRFVVGKDPGSFIVNSSLDQESDVGLLDAVQGRLSLLVCLEVTLPPNQLLLEAMHELRVHLPERRPLTVG